MGQGAAGVLVAAVLVDDDVGAAVGVDADSAVCGRWDDSDVRSCLAGGVVEVGGDGHRLVAGVDGEVAVSGGVDSDD